MTHSWGGVDPRSADDLVMAEYDGGSMFLVHQALDPARLEAAFRARMADVQGRAVDHPSADPIGVVTRLWGGLGTRHETLVVFGREAAGLAVAEQAGESTPLRAAELFATQRLKRARPAWRAPPLDRMAELLGDAPARAAAPGPFQGAWGLGLGGLLAGATAVGVAVREEGEALEVTIVLTGGWGDRAEEARGRLQERYARLVESGLGRLMGIDRPVAPPVVSATADALRLDVRLHAPPLFRGLRDATTADLQAIMSRPDAP